MSFGSMGNPDRDDCIRIIHRALDAGINVIDTADVYSAGQSEEIVGAALKGRRDDVVLATKSFNPMGRDPNRRGSSRRWIIRACEDSLQRLGTDHVDLYQLHRPDENTDIEETLEALTDLVRQGKVRLVGSSTFPAEAIVEAQWAAERRGAVRLRSEQPPYSIFVRGIERDVLPACRRYGIVLTAYCPLGRGRLINDPVIAEMARARGKTVAQITLRWLVQQDGVVPIPRSSNPARMAENLDVFSFSLSDDEMARIAALKRPDARIANPAGRAPAWD